MQKVKIELEYPMRSSCKILYSRLITSTGLSKWFADDVEITENYGYKFLWNKTCQIAMLLEKKDNKFIKFQWIDDVNTPYFFEFRLIIRELTGDLSLIITDFTEFDEIDDTKELWDKQISKLKQSLGISSFYMENSRKKYNNIEIFAY